MYGAAAGAIAVVLFLIGGIVEGGEPAFDGPAAQVAAELVDNRDGIQAASVFFALFGAFFVWFLATVATLAREHRAAAVAFGCGTAFVALFLADVTVGLVAVLRPANALADPELTVALRDVELLLMGAAAPLVSAMLIAFALIPLWPLWVAWLALAAAAAYMLRIGTLLTTDGPFAADGALGIYVPAGAVAVWGVIASVTLAIRVGRAVPPAPAPPPSGVR